MTSDDCISMMNNIVKNENTIYELIMLQDLVGIDALRLASSIVSKKNNSEGIACNRVVNYVDDLFRS